MDSGVENLPVLAKKNVNLEKAVESAQTPFALSLSKGGSVITGSYFNGAQHERVITLVVGVTISIIMLLPMRGVMGTKNVKNPGSLF